MQLTQSSKFNGNYAAKIVEIKEFIKHPNPKCERLKCCTIDGYSIAVGIDTNPGTYIYFPIECAIDDKFLSANNLFRDKYKNANKEQSGFFEDNGRVKIIKLQGYPSEGFIVPITYLYNWLTLIGKRYEIVHKVAPGTEFDSVDGEIVCRKYVPKTTCTQSREGAKISKKLKMVSKVIDTQFRYHYNTCHIKKVPSAINPNDIISITAKVHGTSGISAYVLCKRPKKWYEKVYEFLTRKEIDDTQYDYLWSSRSVIKNPYYNETTNGGFYGVDIWKYADDIIRPHLQKGMTCYYEIIGYLPNGGAIQKLDGKAYDYGFEPPKSSDEYKYGKNFEIQIYRITYTNPDGHVYEFSAKQVQQWCFKNGLISVEEYYYGYAKDLYPDLSVSVHWNEKFLQRLANDKSFFMECESPACNNKVPHKGIVIRIENSLSEAYELKCLNFLEGESNIETES